MSEAEQVEVPGTERPRIEVLEASCLSVMKAEEVVSAAKDKLKLANSVNLENMKAQRELGTLERDADDNHVYVFINGARPKTCVLKASSAVSFRDNKKPKLVSVELEE